MESTITMRLRHRGVTCKTGTRLWHLTTVSSICLCWSRRSSLFSVPSEERKMISGCVARNSTVKAERRPEGMQVWMPMEKGHYHLFKRCCIHGLKHIELLCQCIRRQLSINQSHPDGISPRGMLYSLKNWGQTLLTKRSNFLVH